MVVNGEAGSEQHSGLRRRQASKDLHTLFVAKSNNVDAPSSDKDYVPAVPCVASQDEETAIPERTFNAMLEEIRSAHTKQIADLKEEHQDALSRLKSNNIGVKTAISGLRHTSAQMQQRLRDEVNAKEIAERRCQELGEQLKFKDSQIEEMASALQARQVSYDELMSRYSSETRLSQERQQTTAVKEQMIAALSAGNAAKDQEIAAKQQAVDSKDEKIFELGIEIDELSEKLSQKKAYTELEKQTDIIADLQKENRRLREDKLKSILGCSTDATLNTTILEAAIAERDDLQKRFDAEQVKNHLLGVATAKARDEAFFYSIKANVNAQAFEEDPSAPSSVTDLLKLREKQIHEAKTDSVSLAEANMKLMEEVTETKRKLGEAEHQVATLKWTVDTNEKEMGFLRDSGNEYKRWVERVWDMLKKKFSAGEFGDELKKYDEMIRQNHNFLITMVRELKEEKDVSQRTLEASRVCCSHFSATSSSRAEEISKLDEKYREQTKEMVAVDLENTALNLRLEDKDAELSKFHEEMRNLTQTLNEVFESSQPEPVVARLRNNESEIARLQKDLDEANAWIRDHEWKDQEREHDAGAEIEREVMHVEEQRKLRGKLEKALAVFDKLEALIVEKNPFFRVVHRGPPASLSPIEKEIRELGEMLTCEVPTDRDDLEGVREAYYHCADKSERIKASYDRQIQLNEELDWVGVHLFRRMLWLEGNLRACGMTAHDFRDEPGQPERAELMQRCDVALDLREEVVGGEALDSSSVMDDNDSVVEPEETLQAELPQDTENVQEHIDAANDSQPRVEPTLDDSGQWEDIESMLSSPRNREQIR